MISCISSIRSAPPSRKVLGVISDLPIFGTPLSEQPKKPWVFTDELKKTYDLKEVVPNTETIDPGIDLLLVIHPKGLTRKLQFAIDQYVLGGGNIFSFSSILLPCRTQLVPYPAR